MAARKGFSITLFGVPIVGLEVGSVQKGDLKKAASDTASRIKGAVHNAASHLAEKTAEEGDEE